MVQSATQYLLINDVTMTAGWFWPLDSKTDGLADPHSILSLSACRLYLHRVGIWEGDWPPSVSDGSSEVVHTT